jgi:hypothetical protein
MDEYRKHNRNMDANINSNIDGNTDCNTDAIYNNDNDIEEILLLKSQKRFPEAAEKAELLLNKKVLPPLIKKRLLFETVDIFLEISRYNEAQELLQIIKEIGSINEQLEKDIEYRILYIGIIKELLLKNKRPEMPWSTIPRLIMHQADQEIDKLMPSHRFNNQVATTAEDNSDEDNKEVVKSKLSRNRDVIDSDKKNAKKDTFWIFAAIVILVAALAGFMLAIYYLNWNSSEVIPDASVLTQSEIDESDVRIDVQIDGTTVGQDGKQVGNQIETLNNQTVKVDMVFSPGDWNFIQAGAFSNAKVAENTYNKLIDAGIYAELISEEPILLMVFAGTTQAQTDKILEQIKMDDVIGQIPMYNRTITTSDYNVNLEVYEIYEDIIGLMGERMAGYLRMVSDTSNYLLTEQELEKRIAAVEEIINTGEQLQEQIEVIIGWDGNDDPIFELWQTELTLFANKINIESILANNFIEKELAWKLQAHLFNLLVPQIW